VVPIALEREDKECQNQPLRTAPEPETDELSLKARLAITRLLHEIRELSKLLKGGLKPSFTAAYQNRSELSARGKRILDGITDNLSKRGHRHE
jgi:hypothetical protein